MTDLQPLGQQLQPYRLHLSLRRVPGCLDVSLRSLLKSFVYSSSPAATTTAPTISVPLRSSNRSTPTAGPPPCSRPKQPPKRPRPRPKILQTRRRLLPLAPTMMMLLPPQPAPLRPLALTQALLPLLAARAPTPPLPWLAALLASSWLLPVLLPP